MNGLFRVMISGHERTGPKLLGNKGFISFTDSHNSLSLKSGSAGTQAGQNLETGADVEAVDRCCIQACLTLLCLFPSRPQDHQPRDGTTYNGQGPLLLVTT